MPEEITFTTAAFGGFEKKQVLDYIYKMHEEIDKDRDRHQKKLNEISIAFKELEARALNAEQIQQNLKNELSESQSNLSSEKQLKEQYQQLNSELKLKLEQYKRIISQRNQQETATVNERLHVPVNTDNTVGYSGHEDTEAASQIGRVMLEAHSKANTIINDAKVEAEKIINDARISIEEIRKQHELVLEQYRKKAESDSNQIINIANQRTSESLSKAYSYARSMMQDIANATNIASSNFGEINEQVKTLNNSTEVMRNSIQNNCIENIAIPETKIPAPIIKVNLHPIEPIPQETTIPGSATFSEYDKLFEKEMYKPHEMPTYSDNIIDSNQNNIENFSNTHFNFDTNQSVQQGEYSESTIRPIAFPSLDQQNLDN